MNDLSGAAAASASGMKAQAARLRFSAENIANADTPGYRRKLLSFEAAMNEAGAEVVRPGRVSLSQAELARVRDPAHPLAGADGTYEGSNVDMVIEIADAREAQRSFEANLRLFDQARSMKRALLDLLRR